MAGVTHHTSNVQKQLLAVVKADSSLGHSLHDIRTLSKQARNHPTYIC